MFLPIVSYISFEYKHNQKCSNSAKESIRKYGISKFSCGSADDESVPEGRVTTNIATTSTNNTGYVKSHDQKCSGNNTKMRDLSRTACRKIKLCKMRSEAVGETLPIITDQCNKTVYCRVVINETLKTIKPDVAEVAGNTMLGDVIQKTLSCYGVDRYRVVSKAEYVANVCDHDHDCHIKYYRSFIVCRNRSRSDPSDVTSIRRRSVSIGCEQCRSYTYSVSSRVTVPIAKHIFNTHGFVPKSPRIIGTYVDKNVRVKLYRLLLTDKMYKQILSKKDYYKDIVVRMYNRTERRKYSATHSTKSDTNFSSVSKINAAGEVIRTKLPVLTSVHFKFIDDEADTTKMLCSAIHQVVKDKLTNSRYPVISDVQMGRRKILHGTKNGYRCASIHFAQPDDDAIARYIFVVVAVLDKLLPGCVAVSRIGCNKSLRDHYRALKGPLRSHNVKLGPKTIRLTLITKLTG